VASAGMMEQDMAGAIVSSTIIVGIVNSCCMVLLNGQWKVQWEKQALVSAISGAVWLVSLIMDGRTAGGVMVD